MSRFITLDSNNKVIGIRNGLSIVEGEIESDVGEIGQIMQGDGTFITPDPIPTEPVKSLDEQILELKVTQFEMNQVVEGQGASQQELLDLLIEMGII